MAVTGAEDEVKREDAHICVTCGTQFAPSIGPPQECPICADQRQFVGLDGQQWTTLAELRAKYSNKITPEESGVFSIHTQPHFAIGQRALLLQTRAGNVLWDCLALLDKPTMEAVRELGGISAIAISHPHYYTAMVEWSTAFGDVPIYLHAADHEWVMRPHANIRFWSGASTQLLDDLTLVHTPGHFDGFQVLYWPAGADGKGVLFSGDQPQVCMDTRWVSFMYSYPNYIPLDAGSVERMVGILNRYRFDRIYGAFPQRTVQTNANEIVRRSAKRYVKALEGR